MLRSASHRLKAIFTPARSASALRPFVLGSTTVVATVALATASLGSAAAAAPGAAALHPRNISWLFLHKAPHSHSTQAGQSLFQYTVKVTSGLEANTARGTNAHISDTVPLYSSDATSCRKISLAAALVVPADISGSGIWSGSSFRNDKQIQASIQVVTTAGTKSTLVPSGKTTHIVISLKPGTAARLKERMTASNTYQGGALAYVYLRGTALCSTQTGQPA